MSLRLFLTVWLGYAAFATTNVVRETYLAVALATDLTVRVDPYLGLHPDLFEIPGRGAYINSNPGASMFGAIPYAASRPLIGALFAVKPELGAPKPPAAYDDARPNRTRFMNEMRARGLDVRLALAALVTQVGLMAPAAAMITVLLFGFLRSAYGLVDRSALAFALLYAFGTPLFFRSAFLNQNALLAHAVLLAWMALRWPRPDVGFGRRWFIAGLLLGIGILLDYSGASLALAFGALALYEGFRDGGMSGAMTNASACIAGATGPVLVLLGYQWIAFGSPWFPAQRYMPATPLSVVGWNGLSWPTADLLWRNMLDPRFGLLVFCPLLALAIASPFVRHVTANDRHIPAAFALLATLTLWLFNSANQFALLQWNTGVRYMIPVVPLLFLALIPVLLAMRPAWRAAVIVPTVIISFAVSMTREDVPKALQVLVSDGPTLPVLVVLSKTAGAYAPFLGNGVQPWGILSLALLALAIFRVWRIGRHPSVV